jgi:hypothetical protein
VTTSRAGHLTSRFFGSVRARRPDVADVAWVELNLTAEELDVWRTLGRADAAESVAVARRTARSLGPDADPRWIACALLHDVGKTDAELGTAGRVFATLVAGAVSHGRARRFTNRIGTYVAHDDRGQARLTAAGARPEAAAWAGAHHRRERWVGTGIPPEVCEVLAAADGE